VPYVEKVPWAHQTPSPKPTLTVATHTSPAGGVLSVMDVMNTHTKDTQLQSRCRSLLKRLDASGVQQRQGEWMMSELASERERLAELMKAFHLLHLVLSSPSMKALVPLSNLAFCSGRIYKRRGVDSWRIQPVLV